MASINIAELILFCFAVTGMTLILVQGAIFEPFRAMLLRRVEIIERRRVEEGLRRRFTVVEFLHGILQCLQCAGFWCGIFCGLFILLTHFLQTVFLSGALPVSLRSEPTFFICFVGFLHRVMLLFCCGAAGSFLAPLGDLLLQWIFISKELATKKLLPENTHHHNHQTTQNQTEQNNIDKDDNNQLETALEFAPETE
ncbi:MAG: DUF1360 domain-containing protein [Planctomycetaceae bacterium]|jgi:hypothetical protein|nr:DUF1360 domain-containing protein [Planctomycetaceae bacterium]